jgi:hypothetical protein
MAVCADRSGHCTGWRAVNALANAYGDGIAAPAGIGKIFAIVSGPSERASQTRASEVRNNAVSDIHVLLQRP